jgi:predicted ATPase
MGEPNQPFVRRVVLRNYKSIKECDVSLGPLNFLVGPNGSGKSNFLDALRFVADSLSFPMAHCVRDRGGINAVCNRFQQERKCFSIHLELGLPDGGDASYTVLVVAKRKKGFEIEEEECRISPRNGPAAKYRLRNGRVQEATFETTPRVVPDRLYLTVASSFPEFRDLYDLLSQMKFYSIHPEQMRTEDMGPEPPGTGSGSDSDILMPDGEGACTVLWAIRENRLKQLIDEYMRAILPGLERITVESLSEYARRASRRATDSGETATLGEEPNYLWFVQRVDDESVYFPVRSMSDGTLRAFGVLLALFQCVGRDANDRIPLVGMEEPEAALHPAAAGVLFDALREASHFTQVLVCTHCPDLLDIPDLDVDSLLIVDMVEGKTVIGAADDVSRSIMRDRLSTAGELLRQNHLRPREESPGPVRSEND